MQVTRCEGHSDEKGQRAPSQFYILNNFLDFINEGVDTQSGDVMTEHENRPRVVSSKTAADCVKFLIEQHELI